ncbi:Sensory box histidine kinase [Fictibacillus macauensis ZFHKF-1]|uniref:Sensory box histidine kinase n=1 Tax=Fictibacillus macauensis ZFHKF-1 TaxID=1196324 RepID=I8AGL8_9BACL|nr:GGDEF domain-containing protein [Fictibacillus macauensis]EIT84534.1 Sensory box histidine kinase [Fictibacillus macauensis ZFHKF-1]
MCDRKPKGKIIHVQAYQFFITFWQRISMMIADDEIARLKKRLYTRQRSSITHIIQLQEEYLRGIPSFRPYVTFMDETYKAHLETLLTEIMNSAFLSEQEFTCCLKQTEKSGYERGYYFAGQKKIPHQEFPVVARSLQLVAGQAVRQLLQDETPEVRLLIFDRWGQMMNALMYGAISGYFNKHYKEIQEISLRDPLTNLYNRRHFYQEVARMVSRAQATNEPLSLVMIDINRFKLLNDHYGHLRGDEILKKIADAAAELAIEFGFRFGGDEFVFLLPNTTEHDAGRLAAQLEARVRKWDDTVSLAYGAVELHHDADREIHSYLHKADQRMYANKKQYEKT